MVKNYRRKFNLNMLGLIETKKAVLTKFEVVQLWGNDAVRWEFVGAESASGGLLLMWDETVFKMNNCYKGDRWLCVDGVLLKNNFLCAFCLVYGAHAREEKLVVWEELSFLSGLCQVPVCYLRDFNEVTQVVEERKGAGSLTVSAVEFKSWIQDMELVDLPLTDRTFTWFRGQSCSRIDRVLVTRMGGGPRPFRSLDSWFSHEGFLRMVKEEWRNLGDIQFMDKLKGLTIPLGKWHKQNFGNMDMRIK
ncbi:uncharacterized protein LOC107611417 [Arachis ipaensis]|uniref:uncharacterized protein LOC107611417 n=1 Tax=Arachis ipaensis TaxID=130454 RepID=UPI0007AF212C|nr:uncharacterized protein LOC107611417 [Arachis ipaensis]XP_025670493.1 uncharacterized protein LOC112770336 [Arachis hypogaea]